LRAAEAEDVDEAMGSFLPGEMTDEEFDAMCVELGVVEPGEAPLAAMVGPIPADPESRKRRPKRPIADKRRR